ncbi:type VI secretion system Hcp family effector [Bacillus tianshenii]|uniref:Type VI secretion system Hcp family effector n=1 Tax=Sutcliffiella tianshenii TaxID=1463404 RepID=A0ABS2NVU5_9BACI|nr:type VI secretion system tube protein Hcp [Bacillus tianshenii]MBM7618791.1 type VI secretion system Hcp family effector [Bacillus tianshenii]
MALRLFLAIPGIPGNSTVIRFEDSIELLTYSLNFFNSVTSQSLSTFTASRATLSPLVITKRSDRSSLPLLFNLLTGRTIREMTLYVTDDTGGDFQTLFIFTLENVKVTQFNQSGEDGADSPMETINFRYTKITIESDAFDANQVLTYDTSTNRATFSDGVT